MRKLLTLCVVHKEGQVLLGMKKVGFGQGRWNGFGGKVADGEDIEEAAKRELQEEAGIVPKDLKKRGILTFEFVSNPELLEVHVFSSSDFEGEPAETEEMQPKWFLAGEIPFDQMWPDDRHWFPLLLAGKNFQGHFLFRDNDTLIQHRIEEV